MPRNDYPQAVFHYQTATKKIYGKNVWVPTLEFPRFRVLEDDLREIGASSKDYAYTVLEVLRAWTEEHHMDHVPTRMFCGKFAMKKFLKVWKSETVSIEDTSADELKHDERLVAELYLSGRLKSMNVTLDNAVSDIRPLLSKKWLEMYDNKKYRPCLGDVIDELCAEFGISYARDYDDLATRIAVKNGKSIRVR